MYVGEKVDMKWTFTFTSYHSYFEPLPPTIKAYNKTCNSIQYFRLDFHWFMLSDQNITFIVLYILPTYI